MPMFMVSYHSNSENLDIYGKITRNGQSIHQLSEEFPLEGCHDLLTSFLGRTSFRSRIISSSITTHTHTHTQNAHKSKKCIHTPKLTNTETRKHTKRKADDEK